LLHRITDYCIALPVADAHPEKQQSGLEHLIRKTVVLSGTVGQSAQFIAQTIALARKDDGHIAPPDLKTGSAALRWHQIDEMG
jgi:hypothetical protein